PPPPGPALRRLQPGQPVPSAGAAALALGADRNPARPTLQNRRPRSPDRPLHPLPPRQRLALPEPVPLCRLRRQQRLTRVLIPELTFHPQLLRSRAQNLSARHLYPLGPHTRVLLTPLIAQSLPTNTLANQNPSPHELSRLDNAGTSVPRRILAAFTVFTISIAMVRGPTPPGTGVIAPATSA